MQSKKSLIDYVYTLLSLWCEPTSMYGHESDRKLGS